MSSSRTRYTSKQVAVLVILVAMAMVLSFVEFPLIPDAPWLKYDPASIVALVASLCFGPWVGSAVSVLAWVPRLVTDPLGSFMNIAAALAVVVPLGLLYRRNPTFRQAVFGAVVGSVCSIAVSLALNFVVTPIYYTPLTFVDVAALVPTALFPFNAAKLALNCTVALFAYRRLAQLLAEDDGPQNSVEDVRRG